MHSLATPQAAWRSPQHRATLLTVVALHLAAGWGLLQVQGVRQTVQAAAPLFVQLLSPASEQARPQMPRLPPQATPSPPLPAPTPIPVVMLETATALPAQAAAAMAPASRPAAPPAAAAPVATAALPAALPPPPRELPASAVQYLVLPDIAYPAASRRLNEQGLVIVAVWVGTDGVPGEVQVVLSSGFDRLDRAALAGVRAARFKPYLENGRPVAGWARIPIPFELQHGR